MTRPPRAWLAAVFAAGLIACAAGSTDDSFDGGGGAGDGTTTGTGETGPKGDARADTGKSGKLPIGSDCKNTAECAAPGTCTPLGSGDYCTEPCPASCPTGTYCSLILGAPLCVPDLKQECLDCTKDSDCKLPSDACLTSPQGDRFCARDCTPSGDQCPTGFTCIDKATYAITQGPGSFDAGLPDGSVPDGGVDAGTNAGSDGGGPTMWCVPNAGASCTCDANRGGVTESCVITNSFGTCPGQTTCVGATGKLKTCNAEVPIMEICNGVDDNCNGQIDEGDPNTLCGFMGAPPTNSSWVCMNGACSIGACDPGWAAFPPGPLANGCSCPVNPGDADGLCDEATQAGGVIDVGGTPLVIAGTLSSATEVAVYAFTSTDMNEMTTNSYHVAITFTAPVANTEFVMDVERGDPCNDTPDGMSIGITSYDWCVNATSATAGEAPCGPTAVHHCANHSANYYVRVYRAAGATPTCSVYEVTVTGGGGECNLTQTCM